ncbi:MCE family protein [Nocardia bovistercoris]|uniref:MCE family protein n=1 Tax=Nocardia bovistercoris TaxID=2785916 RepID=A0A931IA28_9NOCA|nr:MCE family protein [Nocardia bovistercoris]MBH0776640.1 MCE family protein [Nocardia bovistercoris]
MSEKRSSAMTIGVVGIVLAVTVSLSALQLDRLPFLRSGASFTAYFGDAGGLVPGDAVQVAGVRSGRVESVELSGAKVLVRFTLKESIVLGDKTSAAIKTNTVLGRKSVEVYPSGSGALRRDDPIPLERTNSPYSLNQALSDLGGTIQGLDTDRLDQTLDELSATFADTSPAVRTALDGVTALSRTVNIRDEALLQLLTRARNVTGILAEQSSQITALLSDGNELLGELESRRAALGQMIVNLNALAQQLSGVIADNEAQLAPALEKLNSVLAQLERNRNNITEALAGLGPYAAALGEQVGSGPYFQAYVSNANSPLLHVLVDALAWPQNLPESLRAYFTPPPSIGPGVQEPPR